MITPEDIFHVKQQMQESISAAEKELQVCMHEQGSLTAVQELAVSILRYEAIEHRIENYAHIFSFFASPIESILNPLEKTELLAYVHAAAEIDPAIARFSAERIANELRVLIQSQDSDTVDMIEAEYKQYILPAFLIAGMYTEANDALREMIRYCSSYSSEYGKKEAVIVLRYAVQIAIDMLDSLDGLIASIRSGFSQWLLEEDQVLLLDACEERMASVRFDTAQREHLAHEKAVALLERRERSLEF